MKALSFGCAASMRPSRLCVSSVTENSLARNRFASSASVDVCIFLLDDLGDEIQRGFDLRSVALVELVLVLFGHDVGSHALCETRERMSHGLDPLRGSGIELPDEIDDLRKAVLVDRDLGFGQRETCEMRDRVDLVAIEAHRKLKQKMWEMCAESYPLPCGACCRLLNCRHFFALRLEFHV